MSGVIGGSFPAAVPPLKHPVLRIRSSAVDLRERVLVMAVVNRTPDSFFDRGRTFGLDAALEAAGAAVEGGADWVDIGGQPFRTGQRLSVAEELDRVLPVVQGLRARSEVVISVDTFEPEVAARCLAAGADVVNDTTGLRDPDLAAAVADGDGHVVIAHCLAPPRTPWPSPRYDDVVDEVRAFLERRAEAAVTAGIPEERIVLDPGHDLNKTTVHSLELTRRLDEIAAIGLPVLAAVSRKDFVGETLDLPVEARLPGTLAAAVLCVLGGARVLRMHDVTSAVQAVRMTEAVLGLRAPATQRHNLPEASGAA
jgi:dihydropteroate synthase